MSDPGRADSKPESEAKSQPEAQPYVYDESFAPVGFTDLFRYATRFELFLDAIGILCAAAAGAAQPLLSLLLGTLTQGFVTFGAAQAAYSQNTNNATAYHELQNAATQFKSDAATGASYLLYIGIAAMVCTNIYTTTWVYTGEQNIKRIRKMYLRAVLHQDIAYFDSVGAGEIATRIQTDTQLIQRGTSQKVPFTVYLLSSFFASYILAYVREWRIALALSSMLPCIAIAGGLLNKFASKYTTRSLTHVADGGTLAEEAISTVRTAHAFGIQNVLSNLYNTHAEIACFNDIRAAIALGGCFGFFFFVIYSAYALAFQFGTTLINEGHATAGQVIAVNSALLIGSFGLGVLAPELQAITQARGAAAKLFATIARIPDIDSSDPGGLKAEKVVGEITLEDVKFSYPSRPGVPIVKGINITFAAGQTAALVGASGSGKSTIISLIERFYDPLDGSVKLDGVDLRDLNIKWLRSQIGLVSQEPTLFATTVRGNVAHGLINTPYEHLPEDEKFMLIKEACIKANADGFISKLPNGYDTMVGERGFLLSGGQKQRVAIARAIVSDPRILLLDEATSALDTQSEEVVQDALDKAAAGRTTITIAHRLSTVKDADCIYVMGDGLVLEKGTHVELLADENSAYSRLVQAQKLRDKNAAEDDESAEDDEIEKLYEEEIPLARKETIHSVASSLVRNRNARKRREADEDQRSILPTLLRIILLYRPAVISYAIGASFAIVTGMVFPVFGIIFGRAIAGFSEPNPSIRQHNGNMNGLGFFIIALCAGFATAAQKRFFATASAQLTMKLRTLCFKAILKQDIEYFDHDENNTGILTANLSENAQKINNLAGNTLGSILEALVTVVGGSIVGLCYAWKPALVGMACFPVILSSGYVRLRVILMKEVKNKVAYAKSAQLACEAAGSIRTVASLTREEECLKLYDESLIIPRTRSQIWTEMGGNALYSFTQSISFFIVALLFWYGSSLVSRFEIDTTAFFTALMSTTMGAIQASNMFASAIDMAAAASAGIAITKLLDSRPEIDTESSVGKTFEGETVEGQIVLEKVYFRYPTRPKVRVLRDLSLKIEPGTYVALVGASGCGKSTVIQLMERFYDPLAGRILLDGKPIDQFNVQEYRKQIALVSQEPTLYAGTIRFNILLGASKLESEVTQEEIEAVCRDANILDFIQALPDGFDTQVGGKGSQLSGGQKQRIAIARALLRNPKVLLLDEATSALDSNSEKIVQDALDKAAKGRTTIAIAHRLSTIQNADCIYFIKDGRVSEAGTHDELLSLRGGYYSYVQLQALSKK